MGFFDTPSWARRLVEDEVRLRKDLAAITELTRLKEQAARMFEAQEALNKKFATQISTKVDNDARRILEQMRASLAWPSAPFGVGSQYDPWVPALQPEHFTSGADRLQHAIDKAVERALAKRDPPPVEVDPELYGRDGVRRQPGFQRPSDSEDDED